MPDFLEKLREVAREAGDEKNVHVYRTMARVFGPERHKRDTVNNYLAGGTQKIPAEFIRDFCIAYGISPSWLLLDVGDKYWDPENAARQNRLSAADWMERLAKAIREIDAAGEVRLSSDLALRRLVEGDEQPEQLRGKLRDQGGNGETKGRGAGGRGS